MSDKQTIQSLLWALDTAGIRYSNKFKGFEVNGRVYTDPIEAAQVRAEYIRSMEVKLQQSVPQAFEETCTLVVELSKSLTPSRIPKYQKDLRDVIDGCIFEMRKALS